MWGTPSYTEMGGQFQLFIDMIMTTKTISKVRKVTLSAISSSCPIIAVSLRLLSIEAYSSLHSPSISSVFLQRIESESYLRVIRNDRNNTRSTLVRVISYQQLCSRFTLPMLITLVPYERVLQRIQVQTNGRNVRMVQTSDAVFASIVLLEG